MATFFSRLFGGAKQPQPVLDYERMIVLDAEDLAEQGIKEAYEKLLPELSRHVAAPAEVEEIVDDDSGSYLVRCNGREFVVYAPGLPDSEGESWGRAAYALFALVNEQLASSTVRFYALNGGNDLGGMFLTPEEAAAAQSALPGKSDWPYIPSPEHPCYGQFQ